MKKLLTRFASGLLSREQMRKVKGGYGAATAEARCNDGSTVSCSGSSCSAEDGAGAGNPGGDGFCRCGDDYHTCVIA